MKNTITIFRAAVILNLVFLVLFMTVSGAAAQPLEVWVDDDYCNSCPNDGRTWNYDAFGNIQDGIDAVETAGTVHVAAGVYEGKLYLKPGVFLSGAGIEVSIIDGVGIREGEGDNDALVQLASNSKISGFSIINGGWQGLRCNGVSATIEGNLIAHHEREGIVLAGYGAGHSIIKNNIVTDCFGIGGNSVYYSPQIINNTIVNNRANGIYFWYAGTPAIKNNIIVHNRQNGIAIGGIPGNFAQAITSHNNVWENGVNYFNCDPGVGSISMNPSFSNESIGNYRLNATSPCIDAGTNESPGTTLTDLDGNPRIYNGVVDMGAFEFVSWPITLQAEDYITYYDKTPGNAGGHYRNDDVDIWWYHPDHFYVGSAGTNEWLEYAINLPADGEYRLDIRVATPNNGRRVHVEFDGVDKTGSLTVPNTGGWTTWQTLSTRVELTAGRQVMQLAFDYGGLNIDWISLADTDNRIWYGDYTIYNNDDLALLSGYTSVTGELRIRGDSSITNLASLIDLTSVGGNLSIVGVYNNNSNLSNLEGLNNLVTVKGELILTGNPNIVNLEGLSRLTSVGGMLIGLPDDDDAGYENESLTSLKGLESLSRVKGNIRICGNPGLESLDGLNNLEIIDGSLKFENYNYKNTWTVDNSAMSSVTALRSLVFIGGDLLLGGMENLSSLEGLNNLAFIGGTLSICENINLLELSMTNLGQVNGDFVICRNSRLPPSLAEELMNQVLNRGGIGGKIDLVCRYFVFW